MEKGYLALVLHAHLPYVRHPEYENFLEENWLYEAITETYVPLIEVFEGLVRDGVDFKITMSISPTLAAMLTDPLLQQRYVWHIEKLIELSEKEVHRTRQQPEINRTSVMYRDKFRSARHTFVDKYGMNLLWAFKGFQDIGNLEIVTCGATHGFLPLMENVPKAARAQIIIAAEEYKRNFGKAPRGIWLPECGYFPGVDEYIKEAGIGYFFTDTHGILHASPKPKYGVFAPILCKSGIAAFGRDQESSKQVWSSEEGYPGDYYYREFYRDIGFDLDMDYISPYIHDNGIRINTGIKYYRITGEGFGHKEPYDHRRAMEKAAEHAGNFMFNREKQAEYLYDAMGGRRPVIVSPYDAELFGHWWYEGPDFINYLARKIYRDQKTIKMITPSEYFDIYPVNQVSTPSLSSWGHKGYSEVWLEGSNDWIYRHLHKAAERMIELAGRFPDAEGLLKRALNQAARELLLLQSSDWAFIMKTGTMVEYAVKRTKSHIYRFNRLYEEIMESRIDEGYLKELELKDNIFPEIDYRVYI